MRARTANDGQDYLQSMRKQHSPELRSDMSEIIRYVAPTSEIVAPLCAMARESFSDTFGSLYEPQIFSRFLDDTYGPGGSMERDIADPSIQWLVATIGEQPIGYAKVSPLAAPAPAPKPGAMELRQIYVDKRWHGKGVGDALIEWALNTARSKGAPEIYLTVFVHNSRAKRFYSRYGFSEVGHCAFVMGDRIDDDRVWRKAL